ncbi:MAG: toxic anion resistance protein [Clostridia bacterium]|nr:toxic anion resistance protein [Clostridia bacterium]
MSDFSLEIPNEEEIRQAVQEESKPSETTLAKIPEAAQNNVQKFLDVDMDSVESRRACVNAVESFGMGSIKKSESRNAILQKRMYQFSEAGGESGEVSKGLTDLTLKMKDLDPGKADFLKSGKVSKFTRPVRRYFERYKTADAEISSIIKSLDTGKKTLVNDNTTLELEQDSMRELTKEISTNIEVGMQLDAALEASINNMLNEGVDDEKLKFLQEEVLYPLRQRVMDFQQLLVVDQQGIIAMEIIRRNNKELIRSVDRAKLVTVSALRTAVTVAGALYDQKIVLEKVSALNSETERMIEATGKMLREQGTAIHEQSESANLSPEVLLGAFNDAIAALDEISEYKTQALPKLKQTISDFRTVAEEGEKRIRQMEEGVD